MGKGKNTYLTIFMFLVLILDIFMEVGGKRNASGQKNTGYGDNGKSEKFYTSLFHFLVSTVIKDEVVKKKMPTVRHVRPTQ